jgi:hypothetical protein
MGKHLLAPLAIIVAASSAVYSQAAPAPDGGTALVPDGGAAPAPDGGAAPAPDGGAAPAPEEPPVVMLEGGVTATRAPAKPTEQERYRTQRGFAALVMAGLIDGFGLGARVGTPRIGLDLSAAYVPTLATYSQDTQHAPKYKLLSALQANATAYFGLYRASPRTDIGISAGYKYNTVLKHGVSAAFYTQYDIAEHWALHMFVGPAIFPRADRGIRDKAGWPDQGSVGSGLSWMQGGFGLSLAFFP